MKSRYTAVLALALPLLAGAQDISTEITVDRTIVPEQRNAVRPASFVPSIQLPEVELKPLSIHEYLKPSELTTIVPVLEPAGYADTIAVTPYRGYAAVGYFPVYNLGASAGYRFINTHNTRLGAWMQFDGNSYKGTKPADDITFSDNTFTLGADFNRLFRPGQLAVGLEYTYGRTGIPLYYDGYHQNVNLLKADASWWGRYKALDYHASFEFEHFGFNNFFNEQRYTPELGVMFGGAKAKGGIELKGDFLSGGNGIVSIAPYYIYSDASFHARVGLKLDVSTGDLTVYGGESPKRFHVAPEVLLAWTPMSMFAVEARVTGGEVLNTAAGYWQWCHFISPMEVHPLSNVPVDAQLKFVVGPVAGVSLRLFGGYSMADDWLMPAWSAGTGQAPQAGLTGNIFYPRDIKGWLAGVGVGYRWRDIVDFEATAQMAPRRADRGYYRWLDHAQYVVNVSVKVHPLDKLDIDLGYEFRGRRTVYNPYGATDEINLGNVSDLNAGIAYRISDQLSVWLRGENLLCRRHCLLPFIPAQGIKGLVGVSYKF